MSDILDCLIFDRVQADIDAMTDKAYIDYQDLNRVEDAIKWVSHVLNCYGYRNTIIEGAIWQPEDRRTEREMERIRKNLIAIRSAFYTPPSTPQTPERITYTSIYQANFIEKIIYDIGILVENLIPSIPHLEFKLGCRGIGNRSVSL